MNTTTSDWSVGFIERIVVGAALALVGACLGWLFGPVRFGMPTVLLPVGLSTLYVLWVLYRSPAQSGKLVTALGWLAITGLLVLLGVPFPIMVLCMAGMTWVVRSLFCYNRILPAVLDAFVVGAAMVAGAWAFAETSSVFLAGWSLFLVLAVFVRWPVTERIGLQGNPQPTSPDDSLRASRDRFATARASADAAVQKILRTA